MSGRFSSAATVAWNLHPKGLMFQAPGYVAHRGRLVVVLADATLTLEMANARMEDNQATWTSDRLLTQAMVDGDGLLSVTLTGLQAARVMEVRIEWPWDAFAQPLEASAHRYLVHSREFDVTLGIRLVSTPNAWLTEFEMPSHLMTLLRHEPTGRSLLVGALPPFGAGFTTIQPIHQQRHGEGAFGLRIAWDVQATLAAGGMLRLSPLVLLAGDDPLSLMQRYGQMMGQRQPRAVRPAVNGWNSWDYFTGSVRREDMDEVVQAATANLGNRLKYIIIDEGYEKQWGVWDAGWKFPQGLKDFCRSVRAAGYEPGVWTAPLTAMYYTPLFRYHPDWFLRDEKGNAHFQQLSYGRMGHLDITQPAVQEHLRQTYRHLRDAGFTYFKCDFTQLSLLSRGSRDATVGRADLIRKTFGLIRETIGDDAYLLACGAPFESVIGLVDSIRIGGDIHAYWPHIVQNIRCMLVRWWMQGNVGNVDPDFVIIRCSATSDDVHMHPAAGELPAKASGTIAWQTGRAMNLAEAKLLALATWMTGGDIILGDGLHRLNALGFELIGKVLTPMPAVARPLNLFDPDGMEAPILSASLPGQTIVAFFNLTDEPIRRRLPASVGDRSSGAREFWSGQLWNAPSDGWVTLPPRGHLGLCLAADGAEDAGCH